MSDIQIRTAKPEDAETVHHLVIELAIYERLAHEVVSTPDDMRRALTGPNPMVEVFLAEISGQPVGFALFFPTFSTFTGRPGLYLEDLFVLPDYRRRGVALALLETLFQAARDRNCARVEWSVLDWNESAIKFYTERLGAKILKEWWRCRLEPGGNERERAGTSESV
jgi:GNAT superfamily N-acetyltransferase